MERKKLPIGIEDFRELVTQDFYFVDKTRMIRDLLRGWGKVNLFTRPRRFGKTLNMSMLRRFLEIGSDKELFHGLYISEEVQLCQAYQGKFPVISISLKTVEGRDYKSARAGMCTVIGTEARRFQFLLDTDRLTEADKDQYRLLLHTVPGGDAYSMTDSVLMSSLKTLSDLLYKYYGTQVIILIDEYDVPLQKASAGAYYDEMSAMIRGIFNAALKSNESLYFAVLTGCLRVSKECIFTGLNNPKMYTLLDAQCDEYFGFTEEEVKALLDYYGLAAFLHTIREWYDGYRIGRSQVYNPWDVINYCSQLLTNPDKTPKNYWANSSGNEELKSFITKLGDGVTRTQMERLISGQSVQKQIEEQLTYASMYKTIENMWSLLFATGYLTPAQMPQGSTVRLMIPNEEIRGIFSEELLKLFASGTAKEGEKVNQLCQALKSGQADRVQALFASFLEKTISIRDTAVRNAFKENFYHGLLLGLINGRDDWDITSNREAGSGYCDIQIEIEAESIGIIIEVKYAQRADFAAACGKALQQINDKDYAAALREDGMKTLWKYGIACYKKECRVVAEKAET